MSHSAQKPEPKKGFAVGKGKSLANRDFVIHAIKQYDAQVIDPFAEQLDATLEGQHQRLDTQADGLVEVERHVDSLQRASIRDARSLLSLEDLYTVRFERFLRRIARSIARFMRIER